MSNIYSIPTRRSSDSPGSAGRRCSSSSGRYPSRNWWPTTQPPMRSEEHTSELQSRENLVCRLLLEKKKESVVSEVIHTLNDHQTGKSTSHACGLKVLT